MFVVAPSSACKNAVLMSPSLMLQDLANAMHRMTLRIAKSGVDA
jgi:hypothetical protein